MNIPFNWVVDTIYGLDFAVYPPTDEKHQHSLALVKVILDEDSFLSLEKWVKIAHSVNKELWVVKNTNFD